ncbi:hypothetical protein ACFVJ4_41035 [Streptomyces sp. NPDC127178]|uniref:hypothetical protein n=1 Tax=unclassified Streptomyces TaxID=2593676 RepID=UPI00363D0955
MAAETTGPASALNTHLFGPGPISSADRWVFDLPLADNPCLRTVTSTDTEQLDLADIEDALLLLEFEAAP